MTKTAIHPLTSQQLGDIVIGLRYRTYQRHDHDYDSLLLHPLVHSQGVIHGDLHSVGVVTQITSGKDR